MKLLMTGYQLWGARSATGIDDMAGILRVSRADLDPIVDLLIAEGWVLRSGDPALLTLTEEGARALALESDTIGM